MRWHSCLHSRSNSGSDEVERDLSHLSKVQLLRACVDMAFTTFWTAFPACGCSDLMAACCLWAAPFSKSSSTVGQPFVKVFHSSLGPHSLLLFAAVAYSLLPKRPKLSPQQCTMRFPVSLCPQVLYQASPMHEVLDDTTILYSAL